MLGLYLAVYYLRPNLWVPFLQFRLQLYLGALAIIVIVYHYLAEKPSEKVDNINIIFLLFIFVLIFSKVLTGWLGGSVAVLYKMLPVIVGFYMVLITCTTKSRWEGIVLLLILLTSFMAWQACIQIQTGMAIGELEPRMRAAIDEDGNRIYKPQAIWWGIFRDPNDLGMAFAVTLPLIMNKIHQYKIIYILFLSVILAGVFYTNSRGTLLGAIVGLGLFYILRKRSITGLIMAGLVGSLIVLYGPSRMGEISTTDSSSMSRLEAWYVGLQLFKSNPLFGVGTDSFTDYHHLTAHNTYVLLLAEVGFVGLLLFTMLITTPLYVSLRTIYQTNDDVERSNLAAITSSFTSLCFTILFISRPYVLLPYLYGALNIAYLRINQKKQLAKFSAHLKLKYMILLVISQIILFYLMTKLL